MKRREKPLLIALIAILAVCVVGCSNEGKNEPHTLELEKFKLTDGNYEYDGIKWDTPLNEFKKQIDFQIEEDKDAPIPEGRPDAFYKSVGVFELDGQQAEAILQFYEEKIQSIHFEFKLKDDYQKWFENQSAALIELNGEPDKVVDSLVKDIKSDGYVWNSNETTLQIRLISGEGVEPRLTIGVAFIKNITG